MCTSSELFIKAKKSIPGGVNSPVRAFKSVNRDPLFISKGKGSKIYDVQEKEYLDYVLSWGPLILGHAHTEVVDRLKKVIEDGTSFGAPTERETKLAELIIKSIPSAEMVRLVNSGTEACMSAIRLARGYTCRDKIVKFEGCYHGHADYLLVAAGSGATTLSIPDSPGVPMDFSKNTLLAPYNDLPAVEELFRQNAEDIACVIVEPFAGNMGFVPPKDGFLQGLKDITQKHGAILIFDEVMTGFRIDLGGAQALLGIDPDLTCLGKVIGGGLPVGAYAGKKVIMERIAPSGDIYQAGTLSGNPIGVEAGLATLEILQRESVFRGICDKTRALVNGFNSIFKELGIPAQADAQGTMFGVFFTENKVENLTDAKKCDLSLFSQYFNGMLNEGIYLAPSQFEAAFCSAAHSGNDIDVTLTSARKVLSSI
ncbi:MAG: glutamate-1-semialdehyde 2,1-aminomutase [bacterium]